MADEVMMPGTEGIVASSKQEQNTLENKNYFDNPAAVKYAAYQPSETKDVVSTSFTRNQEWQKFLADPVRNIRKDAPSNYRTYRQLEKMWRQPEFASIIEQHGSDMAVAGQLLSDYVDWDKVSWWDKQVIGMSAARYGMRIGSARTKLAELEHSGASEEEIAAAKNELLRLEQYAQHNTRAYNSETANAFASFGVSAARVVPEMVATSLAIGALIPSGGTTAGVAASSGARVAAGLTNAFRKGTQAANIIRGLKTARAVEKNAKGIAKAVDFTKAGIQNVAGAGIVYNDTYRVTMGDLYNRIKAENPQLTDSQAYDLADRSADLQATLESLPALVGLGYRAATTAELDVAVRSILTKVPEDTLKRAAFMRAFQQEAGNEVAKRIAAGWTKDMIVDTLTEVAQQAAENATMQLAVSGGTGDQVLAGTMERLGGFLLNPLDEKYADELNTLVTTLPAAAVFGGVGPSIAMVGHSMSKGSVGSKMSDVFNNYRFGAQMRAYTQEQIDKVGADAIREQIQGMASRGDAPSSVYFDKAAVKELADTDPEFRKAMARLGVLKQLNESEGNGGVVEVSLADYNEVVNGEKSGVLYQKVKDMVSFRLDSMTMSQLNEWIASTEIQNRKEIQKAIENEKSVYNRTLQEFLSDPMFANMTEDQRKANATLMQLVANRATQAITNPMTPEEWFEKNVLLVKGEPEGFGALNQKTKKSGDNASRVRGLKYGERVSYKQNGKKFIADSYGAGINITLLDKNNKEVSSISVKPLTNGVTDIRVIDKINVGKGKASAVLEEAERIFGDLQAHPEQIQEAQDFWRKAGFTEQNGETRLMQRPTFQEDIIVVDGVARPTLNHDDGLIARTEQGLINFWRWFGDSKVVDEHGRPLVVYHGTDAEFDTFDLSKFGQTDSGTKGKGIYLTQRKKYAKIYGNRIMPLYAKTSNPFLLSNKTIRDTVFDLYKYMDLPVPYDIQTNDDAYDKIYNYTEEFTKYLQSKGFDGVIDVRMSEKFSEEKGFEDVDKFGEIVVFEPNQIKSVDNRGTYSDKTGNVYYQKDEGKIAGWFNVIDGKYVVGLTDNWNATTFSHEVFHMYSRVLQDNYNNGTITSHWKAQAEKLFKTVDAVPNKKGKIKLTGNQEELLAERFTTYLLENEIKNPELNSIFALLRDAFRVTYASTDRTTHQPDKKTKEAFAVIFGAYDVALAEQQALGLLEIEKPEGVSQDAYDHYMSFLLESRARASHDMIKTYYRVEKYKKSKEYAKAYDEEYTRNLAAANVESRFQIKALAKQLKTDNPNDIMLAYNGTHGDALITEDDVIAALNDPAEATQVAEARTAEAMNELIKDKFKIKDDQTLISKDAKNAAMAKAFLMEALMREGKDWKDFEAEYSKLLDAVENEIQKMPLSKLQNSRRWAQLESVYAQQYQMYSSLDNKEKMAVVRRQQAQVVLIQNKMFEMNNRVDRFLEKFPKKLRTAQPQGQDIMSAESWDLLQSLMEQYGFKISDRRRGLEAFNIKLENWLKNIEESEYCPISNIRYFMPETSQGHKGSFGSMTVRQFEVLEHMATAINSVASREYTLYTEAEKVRYDTLAAETAQRLAEKGIKPYDENDTWVRKHLGVLSNIVNPEPIMKALFPESVQRLLIRPFFSAAARAESEFNEWDNAWNQMIQKLNLGNNKKKYSTGHILSYNNVGNLLLAMGNEHSYENWRLFLHLDEAQAEAIVAEALAEQPRLAEFANQYWALMAKTTDIMNDSYRARYNKLFVKKQPRAFKIGEYEFTGGYVPETKLVTELADTDGWESIIMGELSNEKLVSDKPDGKDLQSIIDNTRSRLRLFARWGHVAPTFNNFVRFVQREDVGNVIGSRAQAYIKRWLRDYHTPAGDSAGLMHALMSATTTTVLGIRLPQALLQLSGLIPAMGVLGRGGMRYVTSALGRTLRTGGIHQVALAQTGKSDYMKARYSDPVKTLFGVSKTEMQISKTIGKFQKLAMSMIAYMDAVVSNATWEASYTMSKDNGLSEKEAIEKADQDVRLSQTDSLTVSRSRAMKTDWARIITPFSTYMMGMQSVVRGKIAEKDFYGAFTFALSFIAISTFFEAMLKEMPMPWEPDDDENYIEKVIKRWYNDTVSTAGSTIYPIASIGSYGAEKLAQTVEKVLHPDEPTLIDLYGIGTLSAISYYKQFPDAVGYGITGLFNGDEDAQRKAIANFVGWFSAGGKRMVKDMMEE